MKRLEFYTLKHDPSNEATHSAKVLVNGYKLDDEVAVYKDEGVWFIVDLATGASIAEPCEKRDEAIFCYNLRWDRITMARNKPGYAKAVERFEKSPVKTIEELKNE